MAVAAVDVGYLAASYTVPESTLQSLLSAPTVELVQILLAQIEARAREHDDFQAEKLRSDVELENAVRNSEARTKATKATADKHLKELDEVRQKLSETERARDQLATELQDLKSSTSASTSATKTLESRINALEVQNRDAVSMHEAKSKAHDQLAEDLNTQHKRYRDLKAQYTELERRNQELETAATSAKYREQGIIQARDNLSKNVEFFESEVQRSKDELSKFRKEKNAEIADLKRANEDADRTIQSLRRTEDSQRKHMAELEEKLEQSLSRVQALQDSAIQKQQADQAQIDNLQSLAKLHQQSAKTAKDHLQEIRGQLAQLSDSAAMEVGQLQAEIDTEVRQREAAEAKIAELESQIEGLEAQVAELRSLTQIPATPRRAINGSFGTPGRAGSPSFLSPARSRAGLSTTELYAENTQLKAQLRSLKEDDTRTKSTLGEILEELERRQPEIEELRTENDRLSEEAGQITTLLEEAVADREVARKATRKAQGDLEGADREKQILSRQLRDASAQLRLLLLEQQARDQGMGSLTVEEQNFFQQVEQGQIPNDTLDEDTETGRIISQKLVLFNNITTLQKKNEELIQGIRELSERYEGSEAQARNDQISTEREEFGRLRVQIEEYEDKISGLSLRLQSIEKERDMYRRIVTSRGQLPPNMDASRSGEELPFGMSTARSVSQSGDANAHDKEIARLEKLVKELQTHMDNIRQDSAVDHDTLKQQVKSLENQNGELQREKMKESNAAQLARDRYELLQNRFSLVQSDNDELQKRCNSLQDSAAKQDIQTQQVAQNLIESQSLVDSLEREKNNLKASRDFLKTMEGRLEAEIKRLTEENSKSNNRLTDLQNLHNEHVLTEAETRRRLQTRVDILEVELQTTKRKLEDDNEDHKKILQRRDFEQSEASKKINDLTTTINDMRPELAALKTERDQLQSRVDELKVELRIADERSQHSFSHSTSHVNGSGEINDNNVTREEELSTEISNLKRELESAQRALEDAKAQVAQYKAIAQDAEDRLADIQDAQEELQQQADASIAEKEAKIQDLEKRVDEISSELATTNSELSELRGKYETDEQRHAQQKEYLEAEITRYKDETEQYKEKAALLEEDNKAQSELTQRATNDYTNEVQKHSAALKNLQDERTQHNALKQEVAQYKTRAEAARTSLIEGEENWKELRERFERENSESQTRYNDLKEQNNILHKQLENLSTQIAGLKQSRLSIAAGDAETVNTNDEVARLNNIVNYTRQEKDILEVQLNVATMESKQLKQQLEVARDQLEQTRERLSQEQQTQAQNKESARSLENLSATIEQLNVYRESATTLRNEAQQAQSRLNAKSQEVDDLLAQIEPLKQRVQEVEGELAMKNGDIEMVQRDREHWQKRHQEVLHKYDRIDPAELEGLKTQIETLQTERDQVQSQLNSVDEKIEAVKKTTKEEMEVAYQERRNTMVGQFKERSKELSGKIKAANAENAVIVRERDELQQQLVTLRQELEEAKAARDEAIANSAANTDTAMGEEGQVDEGATNVSGEEKQELENRIAVAETKAFEESNRSVRLHIENQALQSNVQTLENQVGELQQRIASLNAELSQARDQPHETQAQPLESQATTEVSPNDVDKLKEELAAAQKEVEDLKTRADITDSSIAAPTEDNTSSITEQVTQQVSTAKAEIEAKAQERVESAEREAVGKMKTFKDKWNKVHMDKMQALREEHGVVINRMTSEHQEEIARIRQETTTTGTQSAITAEPKEDATENVPAASEIQTHIKEEVKLGSGWTDAQIKDFIKDNDVCKSIIRQNITNRVEPMVAKAKEEQAKADAEQYQKELEQAKSGIVAEQEKLNVTKLEEAKAKARDEAEKRSAAKMSIKDNQLKKANAKLEVVKQAAEETPQRPVGEVWEVANAAQPKPAPSAPQPTPQPAAGAAPQGNQAGQAQPSTPSAGSVPQANGATPTSFGQASFGQPSFNQHSQGSPLPGLGQSPFGQQGAQLNQSGSFGRSNNANQPFQQTIQGVNQNQMRFPGQVGGGQPLGSFNGMTQPGFGHPQQEAQHSQHGGRGRGQDNIGTGPATMRNILGQQNQSGIPRGGANSGIPRPGGRGQPHQNQLPQIPGGNAQGAGASQIGRGGGRGTRGGRGGPGINTNTASHSQTQGQNSPRSLNPGAPGFAPGVGRGGQKRGREEGAEGEAGHQAEKRARGGRGRGGGGGGGSEA